MILYENTVEIFGKFFFENVCQYFSLSIYCKLHYLQNLNIYTDKDFLNRHWPTKFRLRQYKTATVSIL